MEGDQQVEEIPQPQSPNRDNRVGKVMRDYLKAYFNSEAGPVPWQERLIECFVRYREFVDSSYLLRTCFGVYSWDS